jgi:hypothetical protein
MHASTELDSTEILREADMHHVVTLAAQLAAGLCNLGILQGRLAEICQEELKKAWPIG